MSNIWMPIDDCNGTYSVSKIGFVRNNKTGRILKIQVIYSGYLTVQINNSEGNRVGKFIHRLVAIAFIPNPLNLPEVNHLDGNKANCQKSNLEWSTRIANMKHASDLGLLDNTSMFPKKPVYQYDLNMNLINKWDCMQDAASLNFAHNGISNVCTGRRKTYKGFIWKYA